MQKVASWVQTVEPVLLGVIIAAFWFPDPRRVLSLVLLLPIVAARLILYRRPWSSTPLNGLFFLFLLLAAANLIVAPFPRAGTTLGRPLLGMALVFSFVEYARRHRSLHMPIVITLALALLVAFLGLVAAQWTPKSNQLLWIIRYVPKWNGFPGAEGGFNVNEIAGAMAWLAPFAAGIAFYEWRDRISNRRRLLASAAFLILSIALFLGQSRMAIFGVLPAVGALIFLLIPQGKTRRVALAVLVLITAWQLVILSKIFEPEADELIQRDEDSVTSRVEVWESALNIIVDYPLTGVGLNQFRARPVRELYPAPSYGTKVLPHAHNEVLQVGSDMGIPGMIVFIGWHVVIARMLLLAWRRGDAFARAVAASTAAALAAHAFFGLADAIALWDRYAFLFWWMIGIGAAQHRLVADARPVIDEAPVPVIATPVEG